MVKASDMPIKVPGAFGPESLAFDPSGAGPYTSVADGRILKWDPNSSSWVDFAFTSSSRKDCNQPFAPELEHVCGRPLGLRFEQKTGDLYIADAYFGLLRVGPEGGLALKVVTEAEGIPLHFTNDMDIDGEDDIIYFTDSSTKFRRRHFIPSILSGDKTGRFIKYNIASKEVTVLLRDIAFANGVSLSKDRSFVLIAETGTCKILRYWLQGPKAGQVETYTDLPGYPDNIRRNSKGEFWVGLHAKKTPLADWLLRNTWVGNTLLKIPLSFVQQLHALFVGGHHGIVVKLIEEGQVVEVLEDTQGKQVRYASEVEERDGKLWIGSPITPSAWVYDLD
uniref:Strictosidine synthase conserved region domain-containing protein n=1 Tax=Chenopodium quinoa TaxID=63459 RepID=A0A803N5G0_CHEQI